MKEGGPFEKDEKLLTKLQKWRKWKDRSTKHLRPGVIKSSSVMI